MMSTNDRDISMLTGLARKLRGNPAFMSHVLFAYQQQEGLSDEELRGALGAPLELITRLCLCKRPPADSPTFASEVGELSDYTLIDETLITHIIRQVDSLAELTRLSRYSAQGTDNKPSVNLSGMLAAARDHDEEEAGAGADEENDGAGRD